MLKDNYNMELKWPRQAQVIRTFRQPILCYCRVNNLSQGLNCYVHESFLVSENLKKLTLTS
jgi:hypothetical protein